MTGRSLVQEEEPSVTICIFTRNRKDYLRLAIQAALAQTHEDFELLIVDNASTDATAGTVAGFQDPRIRYHRNPFDRGLAYSYRYAVSRARGRRILLTHDDDLMGPTMVESMVRAGQAHPEARAITCNVSIVDRDGNQVTDRLIPVEDPIIFKRFEYIEAWLERNFWLPFPTLMLQRPLYPRLFSEQLWNEMRTLADIYFLGQLNAQGSLIFLAEPLLAYRQHASKAQFQYDQVWPPIRLHRAFRDLCRSARNTRLIALSELTLLKYKVQGLVTRSREPMVSHPRLRHELLALLGRPMAALSHVSDHPAYGQLLALESRLAKGISLPSLGPFHAWANRRLAGHPLCAALRESGVRRIAILGTMLNGYMLGEDAAMAGIEVVTFLDSNRIRQGRRMGGVPIHGPSWLSDRAGDVDVILLSSELDKSEALTRYLQSWLTQPTKVVPWQSLVSGQ